MSGLSEIVKKRFFVVAAFGARLLAVMRYQFSLLKLSLRWLVSSREYTNFTYDLTPLNVRYLARYLSCVCQCPHEEIEGYIAEIFEDQQLAHHLRQVTAIEARGKYADLVARYGRRIGWYALVRATKPKLVVETGVDKGLGACVICAAVKRNSEDGYLGRYLGTDINPKAGYLLTVPYSAYGEIVYGDSIESLRVIKDTVDVFINDSDHSVGYEAAEYEQISKNLGGDSIVIGDNSHFSDKLLNFAEVTGRDFLFFQEAPLDHWYPGGGIGAAFRRRKKVVPEFSS